MKPESDRRHFLSTAAATAAAFTIVPRHVLGGPNVVAPSDKITLAYIGAGTQGLREMLDLLAAPDIQIVAVCDPSRDAVGYRDFSRNGLRDTIRRALGTGDWKAGVDNPIPGGREAARDIVESYYGKQRAKDKFKGCAVYADFREYFDKHSDYTAVKIVTPDHLHGVAAIRAMKKGKHVMIHKPLANRLREAQDVIATAREMGVATHFIPWDSNGKMDQVMAWIADGSIGTLREVHNWSNRPVWPQYATVPEDRPPVPAGFDWDLWLGPEAERPYHPHYTHMVFRGWYDFGGGSMADMGHYSLWSVFNALELSGPTSVEPMLSRQVVFEDGVARTLRNDWSYPIASVVRFRYPAKGSRPAVDLVWHEGGLRPPVPEELEAAGRDLPAEGMMFTGDKGKIVAGFRIEEPRLITRGKYQESAGGEPAAPRRRQQREPGQLSPGVRQWIQACRGGKPSPGSFQNAAGLAEAAALYGVALRTGRKLVYDATTSEIKNVPEAAKYLARQYRKGWEPQA